MSKLTKFEKSQRAHNKLHWKHINNSIGNPKAEVKANYHLDVVTLQRKAGKILPLKERKLLYKYNKQDILGSSSKNPVKRKDYLDIFKKYKVDSY